MPENICGPQLWRLQQLIEWLRRGDKLTTRLAADTFEVSRRTVASDIERLRMLGEAAGYIQPPTNNYKYCVVRGDERFHQWGVDLREYAANLSSHVRESFTDCNTCRYS